MLADGGAPAVLALASASVVLADGGAPAVLADAPLSDGGAPAVLAFAPHSVVLADGGAPAVLALAPQPVVLARPPPMHMKTRETHRQVLLGLYFQRLSDPEWMNEVLAEYDLSNDTDDLISNGIKKGSDLGILMHEPSLLEDLSMTLIAKAKLRMLLNDLSETYNAHPEKDATMAATLDDVKLR